MAFSADPMGYDVMHDFAPRELSGPVYILGKKYELPRGMQIFFHCECSRGTCNIAWALLYRFGFLVHRCSPIYELWLRSGSLSELYCIQSDVFLVLFQIKKL